MNRIEETLERIVLAAEKAGLADFLLIGGNAVIAYGVPRFTRDIDFVILESRRHEWRQMLHELGIPFIHGTNAFLQFHDTEGGLPRVDLMLVDEATWEKLQKGHRTLELGGNIRLGAASPRHLIAMKLRAVRSPHRRAGAQDWSDIVELTAREGFDPENDPEFQELVLRFGDSELLKKLNDEIASRNEGN